MKTKQILFMLFSLSMFIACSKDKKENQVISSIYSDIEVTHSMKGWELYSWPNDSNWYFSILAGTNRSKTCDEVTSNETSEVHFKVLGIDSLKLVLNKFPENEDILLIGQGWFQCDSNYVNLQLPPQNFIDDIEQFCSQKKLKLHVLGQ